MTYHSLDESTKIILKVIFAGLVLAFFWVIRDIILMLLLALILASAMDPMVDYFSKHKIPRVVSVLTVYVLVLGLFGLIIYLIVPPVLDQFKVLQVNLPEYLKLLQERLGFFIGGGSVTNYIQSMLGGFGTSNAVVSSTFGVFNGLFTLLTVLVVSFYLVAEEKGMKNFIAALVPARHEEFTMGVVEKIQTKMGHWIIGQVILSFSIFALSWIGLTLLGLGEYALVLALLAGLFEVIPYIGPFISAVPAVFIAFIQNPPLAVGVAVLYLIIQKTEGYVLVPKVMQKTVGTSPLVVMVALLIGFKLAGIIGLLIAVPLVGAITVVVNELWANKTA